MSPSVLELFTRSSNLTLKHFYKVSYTKRSNKFTVNKQKFANVIREISYSGFIVLR